MWRVMVGQLYPEKPEVSQAAYQDCPYQPQAFDFAWWIIGDNLAGDGIFLRVLHVWYRRRRTGDDARHLRLNPAVA